MDMNMMQQQIRQQLQGMSFPASKQELMSSAVQHGASNDQMEMIKRMPKDNFESVDDVIESANTTMRTS